MTYLTDGVHLYEKISWCPNFGLTRGGWLTVRDCRTGDVRAMCELELALCEPVTGSRQASAPIGVGPATTPSS